MFSDTSGKIGLVAIILFILAFIAVMDYKDILGPTKVEQTEIVVMTNGEVTDTFAVYEKEVVK